MASRTATQDSPWQRRLLNASLVLLSLVVLVLLYSFVTRTLLPRDDPHREANPGQLVGDIIQVEVRNGCGVDGLAADATRYLRQRGFDVVEVGDHETYDEPHTLVIDRVGDLEAARKLALALGVSEAYVRQDIQPSYYLDASVILGRDYATLTPFE